MGGRLSLMLAGGTGGGGILGGLNIGQLWFCILQMVIKLLSVSLHATACVFLQINSTQAFITDVWTNKLNDLYWGVCVL